LQLPTSLAKMEALFNTA